MSVPILLQPAAQPSDAQVRTLSAVVGAMIPASERHGVPGADDRAIFADVLRSLGRDTDAVLRAVATLDALAGGCFADAPPGVRQNATDAFRNAHPALASTLVAVTVRCYYRDDRVMRAIGMEPRPPYPKGFEVEEGDWSLLEPVRARGRIWRDAR
jgi:hypothetical protein